MSAAVDDLVGSALSFWRYPVKSMMGEELNATEITDAGVLGDRAFALVDASDGKVVTAKNPRKWPAIYEFRAAFVDPPRRGMPVPAVRITLPDGRTVQSDDPGVDGPVSTALDRKVTVERSGRSAADGAASAPAVSEEYWPDMDGLDFRDTVTDFELPDGTFFDCATVHVLTTATLRRLRELYPDGRFEVRRFRPNIVVAAPDETAGFVENDWVGRTLRIGDDVRLAVTDGCARCVMTTLAQGDLPKDSGILRTAAQHNDVKVGVYASVLRGGRARRGDAVSLE